jgi:hypothetical protein
MPYGSGPLVRHALIYAKPWQRYLICAVMILGGAALAALGHVAGGVLAAAGAFLLYRMYRVRPRRAAGRPAYGIRSDRSGELGEEPRSSTAPELQ